ncbi:hypothetical protein LWI29_020541 [Acer saccharum]|uniref:Uncharacterized protein n=1 Tax=Acer saccharum TaxID=4024 RepID=A0AA39RYY8_ACESA|nr:hypothetical protein LWI29_020541 [Acer saccharum]
MTSSSLLGPAPPGLPPYKHLTTTEQSEKRAKGLCFYCDKQFKPGHHCKKPQLLLLEAGGIDDADLEDEVKDTSPIIEISMKALTGLSLQTTMHLKGSIREHCVIILVDSVTVGDGGVISSSGKCYNVPVNIRGFQFQLDFYLLPISGCDIVLGVEWLQSLGAILWNFSKLTMKFSWNGQAVKLTGYRSLHAVPTDQGKFNRLLLQEKQDFKLEEKLSSKEG